jgi:CHAT domain-containing protein
VKQAATIGLAVLAASVPVGERSLLDGLALADLAVAEEQDRALPSERIELQSRAEQLWWAGDAAGAVDALQDLVVLEGQIFGKPSDRVAWKYRELVDPLLELEDFAAARDAADKFLRLQTQLHPLPSWQGEEGKLLVAYVARLELLTQYDRRRLLEAGRRSEAHYRNRRYEEAAQAMRVHARLLTQFLGEDHPWRIAAAERIADVAIMLGETAGVERQLLLLLEQTRRMCGTGHPYEGALLSTLAYWADSQQQNDRADGLYRRAIAILEAAGAGATDSLATALNNYATLRDEREEYAAAAPLYRRSLEITEVDSPSSDPNLRIQRDNLARCLESLGEESLEAWQLAQAREHFRESAELYKAMYAADHFRVRDLQRSRELVERAAQLPETAQQLLHEAFSGRVKVFAAADEGDWVTARKHAQRRYDLFRQVLGDREMVTALALLDVANYDTWNDELAAAVEKYRTLEVLFNELVGPEHPRIAEIEVSLADFADESLEVRRDRLEKAAAITAATLGKETTEYASAQNRLGFTLVQLGEYDEASGVFEEALKILRRLSRTDSEEYGSVLFNLGDLHNTLGDPLRAEPYFQEAVRVRKSLFGENDSDYATYLNELANVYYSLEDYVRAEPLYRRTLEVEEQVGGENSADLIVTLSNLARVRRQRGDDAEAQQLLQRAAALGARHAEGRLASCDALRELAFVQRSRGDYESAFAALDGAAEILIASYGAQSVQRADLLCEVAETQRLQGRMDKARDAWEAAWQIYQAAAAKPAATRAQLAHLASSLDDLTSTYQSHTSLDDAVPVSELNLKVKQLLYETGDHRLIDAQRDVEESRAAARLAPDDQQRLRRAEQRLNGLLATVTADNRDEFVAVADDSVGVFRELLGVNHRRTIEMLDRLGDACQSVSCYDGAYRWYRQALDARGVAIGANHPDSAQTARNIGIAARHLGKFSESAQWLEKALQSQRKLLGDAHADYAATLHSLAITLLESGDPVASLPVARTASELHQRLFGTQSTEYTRSLATLAYNYDALGERDRAAALFIKAHSINREILDPDDPAYVDSLLDGATVSSYYPESQELAAQLFDEVLAKLALRPGRQHPQYATALQAYGTLQLFREQYDEAARRFDEAVRIRRAALGARNPLTAQSQASLGQALDELGEYDAAEQQLLAAHRTRMELFGEDHPMIAHCLYRLSLVQAKTGRFEEAVRNLQRSLLLDQTEFDQATLVANEAGLQQVMRSNADKLDLLLTLAVAAPDDQSLVEEALRWALRRKGAVLDALCRVRRGQRQLAHEPQIVLQMEHLRELRQEAARLAVEVPVAPPASGNTANAETVQEEINAAQENLALELAKRNVVFTETPPDARAVSRALPHGAALIELVRYRPFQLNANRRAPAKYVALVVLPDREPPWQIHDLGLASEIEDLLNELRLQTEKAPRLLAIVDEQELESEYRALSRQLFDRLLGPFHSLLSETPFLVIAPDGELHKAPMAALCGPDGSYLVETHDLALVASGRDLLRPHSRVGHGTVVFADPDYDLGADQLAAALTEIQPRLPDAQLPDPASLALASRGAGDRQERGLRWGPLPGAAEEADAIAATLNASQFGPVTVYRGASALEEVFKNIPAPQILHVATHGYFLNHETDRRQVPVENGPATAASRLARLRGLESALLRSGIVLAGANRLAAAPGEASHEDGWVTAHEIAASDFMGVDLVVLSACESGLGDVTAGEGVHGLRRAFQHAGARTLLTSLFKVPDEETRDLMQRFYLALDDGKPKARALADAQRQILVERRRAHGAAHPFYWASFVLLGDARGEE